MVIAVTRGRCKGRERSGSINEERRDWTDVILCQGIQVGIHEVLASQWVPLRLECGNAAVYEGPFTILSIM
jgi:hypothetical protein